MLEYVVDCELRLLRLDGRQLVAPYVTARHVHERIVRCRDCAHCDVMGGAWFVCCLRGEHRFRVEAEGFCSSGVPREGGT